MASLTERDGTDGSWRSAGRSEVEPCLRENDPEGFEELCCRAGDLGYFGDIALHLVRHCEPVAVM